MEKFDPQNPPRALSPHFLTSEAFAPKCDRAKLSVPFEAAFKNAQFLAIRVLEPVRSALNSPLPVNSWTRDLVFNAALATDPASAARVAKRPGPHTDGSACDIRIARADKLAPPDRNAAYAGAFATIYQMALGPDLLPIHEAILEYAKDNVRITHIHLQARATNPARRFVVRKWVGDSADSSVLREIYIPYGRGS